MLNLSQITKKTAVQLFITLIIAIAIPISLILVRTQQELRKKAQEQPQASVYFAQPGSNTPLQQLTLTPDQQFNLELYIKADNIEVNAFDVTVNIPGDFIINNTRGEAETQNFDLAIFDEFTLGPVGWNFRYASSITDPNNVASSPIKLVTLALTAPRTITSGTLGLSNITVVSPANPTNAVSTATTPLQYTVSTASPTPTPSLTPTPIVNQTVTVIEIGPEDRSNDESINAESIAKKFYEKNEDSYDFLAVFNNFNDSRAQSITIKNTVQGIGLQAWDGTVLFDETAKYGSKGKLLSMGFVGDISESRRELYSPADFERVLYGGIIEEVFAHTWGVYVGGVQDSQDPLPVQNRYTEGHWTPCMSFARSDPSEPFWKARQWRDNGDGTWTRIEPDEFRKVGKFDPFMLYLMGFLPPERVPNAILLFPENPQPTPDQPYGPCGPNATVRATARAISINDIIERYGPRVPPYQDSPKEFSVGYILLVQRGFQASQEEINIITRIAAGLPQVFRDATNNNTFISPSPIPTPSPRPTPTSTPIPTPTPIPLTFNADIDKDGCVGRSDMQVWVQTYTSGNSTSNTYPDINNDGRVDLLDFNDWFIAMVSLPQDQICRD